MKIVTWNFHVDDSARGRYYIILGIDILTEMGLNPKLSNHVVEGDDGPFKGSTTPVFDMSMYDFTYFETGKITLEEMFMKSYVDEIYELEQVRASSKRLSAILDAEY